MSREQQLLFGESRAIRKVLDQCERYARITDPLLILGAPGSGKTVIARHIHQLSRRPGAFVNEAASSIPSHLELPHLFGHVRGAFTGAGEDRMGLIEAAHGGTFFLDEVGDASLTIQLLLRQLLENGTVRRVGDRRDRPVDVRFIAATNAPLEEMAGTGSFRKDLLDRFGFFRIQVPALADRRDEILLLVDFFLERAVRDYGLAQRPVLSDAVRDCLRAAPWKGNVRELENLCKYVALQVDDGATVEMTDLPPDFLASMGELMQHRHDRPLYLRARDAVCQANGNKTEAARRLGVSRQHLYRLLSDLRANVS
jgi:two-component system nitrogen regulation response regulator GlnG